MKKNLSYLIAVLLAVSFYFSACAPHPVSPAPPNHAPAPAPAPPPPPPGPAENK